MSSMPCWCQSDSRKSASAARSLPVTSASEVNTSSRWTSSSQVQGIFVALARQPNLFGKGRGVEAEALELDDAVGVHEPL